MARISRLDDSNLPSERTMGYRFISRTLSMIACVLTLARSCSTQVQLASGRVTCEGMRSVHPSPTPPLRGGDNWGSLPVGGGRRPLPGGERLRDYADLRSESALLAGWTLPGRLGSSNATRTAPASDTAAGVGVRDVWIAQRLSRLPRQRPGE